MKKIKHRLNLLRRIILQHLAFPVIYRIGCLRRINPRFVLFASEFSANMPDSLQPLHTRLLDEGYDCRFFGLLPGKTKRQQYLHWIAFFFALAQARTLFLDDYYFPAYACKPRKGTQIVQVWHACGAFKKWGRSTADLAWGSSQKKLKYLPIHNTYTHCLVSSPACIPHYAEAFGCDPAIVHPWGVPRTDIFFASDFCETARAQILTMFPSIGSRRIVLYAPTFRGNNNKKVRHDAAVDFAALRDALQEDCVLLYKPHPRVKKSIADDGAFLYDAKNIPIATLLGAADLVISDYSSLIFEYALFGRPMLFYAYDLENYERVRSFYEPYLSFVPGDLVWSTDDIICGIRRNLFEGGFEASGVAAFAQKHMSACDGGATSRVLSNLGLL
ncbi:MAG: CDP-glycerol glycerophosphotransferase family protein [Oscillospiraceae bacterium]|nr:CDP-glycerol glycerophosphotransferase family protein [Oscillospiraceae bacterium]